MSNYNNEDVVVLQSQDGQDFKVKVGAARLSKTIESLIEDAGTDSPIPLPNVTSKTLTKVVTYCTYHFENPSPQEEKEIIGWDLDFAKVDQPMLFELILAANYLDIKPLLDLTCKMVANMIKGKTPEEIRRTFDIKNDFTPEEEEQVRKENEWCEER